MIEIVGHESQRAALFELAKRQALPHALLLSGPAGIGKRLVALELARQLLCIKPSPAACGKCKSCLGVGSGNCPDFYLIDCRDKENWATKDVRRLLFSLNLKSFGGRARVVVFDNADDLSIQSADALLKTLEEPFASTYLILVSASRSKLPATIVSRCQLWSFESHSEKLIAAELARRAKDHPALDPKFVTEAAALAEGSLEQIEVIIQEREWWLNWRPVLDRLIEADALGAFNLAKELGHDKESLRQRLGLVRAWCRNQMRSHAGRPAGLRSALTLNNLIDSERLIFERNIGATYVLFAALIPLFDSSSDNLFMSTPHDTFLLQDNIV